MRSTRRVTTLETMLTHKQTVLLWLKEAQEFPSFEQYLQSNGKEPLAAAPRVLVSTKVEAAVQASTRQKLFSEKAGKKLMQRAKEEADFLVKLALNINGYLLSESNCKTQSLQLIEEQYRRMVMLYHWRKVFDDKEWTQWRLMLIKILSRLSILKASIAEACKIWFDGNQVMFPDDIEELDQQIEWAQSLAGLYNTIGPRLPTWTEIELAIDTDAIKSDVSRLVRHFVTMARADVLVDDGEVRAARQLVQAQLFATKQAKTH